MNQLQIIVTIIAVIVIGIILVIYLVILKRNGWLFRSDPNEPLNSKQQILNNKPSIQSSYIKDSVDIDNSKKMETEIAEIWEEINRIQSLVDGPIKNYLQKIYLLMEEQKKKEKAEQYSLKSFLAKREHDEIY